jgi:hypothetical protein
MKYSKINKRIWRWILPITILMLLVVVIYYAFSIYYNSKEGLTFKQTKYRNLDKVVKNALTTYFGKPMENQRDNIYEISSDNNKLKITNKKKTIEYEIINKLKNKPTLRRVLSNESNKSNKEGFSLFNQIEGLDNKSESDIIEFTFNDLVSFKYNNIFKLNSPIIGVKFSRYTITISG